MQSLYFQKLFSACPQNNWIVLNDTCYKFQNKISSFNDASNFCTNLGGKIFEPRNNFTDDQVYKSAKQNMNLNHGAWISIARDDTKLDNGTGNHCFFVVWIIEPYHDC